MNKPTNSRPTIKIGIIAGELSGDQIGANLMKHLNQFPHLNFEYYGVGGPKMLKEKLVSLHDIQELAVMGFDDVICRYFKLRNIKNSLVNFFKTHNIDLFIGINASSFNYALAKKLKSSHIPCIQYVSPQIWAWRPRRVLKIKNVFNHIFTLFPFENQFYEKHGIPVTYVGHPLADDIPLSMDGTSLRTSLGIKPNELVIVCMPGSRECDLKYIGPTLIESMKILNEKINEVTFLVPMPTRNLHEKFLKLIQSMNVTFKIQIIVHHSHELLSAADFVLTKSGTSTLEAMLYKKPMIAIYKCGYLTHKILYKLIQIPHISLPNILNQNYLVPELIQHQATPERIVQTFFNVWQDKSQIKHMLDQFQKTHLELKKNAGKHAADAIIQILIKNNIASLGRNDDLYV
jgi:lipid-A-disaccharide synthase